MGAPSASLQERGATCQLRPLIHSRLSHGSKRKRTSALAVSLEEAKHTRLQHARAELRWL